MKHLGLNYAMFLELHKAIFIFHRIADFSESGAINGTKDIATHKISLSNKYDAKKILATLAKSNYDLFEVHKNLSSKVKLKGSFAISNLIG